MGLFGGNKNSVIEDHSSGKCERVLEKMEGDSAK